MTTEQVIIEPILTEKSNHQREANVYTFRVNARANKIEIRKAVEQLFDVHTIDCRVINVHGKPRRTRVQKGRTASWKKAIVQLADGEKISAFEGA